MKNWALVVGLAALLVGCNTDKGKSLAPETGVSTATSIPGAHLEMVDRDGVQVLAWVENARGRTQLARILYYCDFPMGYYGPPSPGHCYEDGSGCTGPPISPDPGQTAAPAPLPGDPTADDSKPQSGDPTADDASDNDGVVIK